MTALEIIALCDEREPNHYDTAQKLRWLRELDMRMREELGESYFGETDCHGVISMPSSHFQPQRGRKSANDIEIPFPIEGQAFNGDPEAHWLRNDKLSAAPEEMSFRDQSADWSWESVLSPDGREELYIQWLISRISAANGETERYNRAVTLFNEQYRALTAYLIRKERPGQPPVFVI